MMNAYVCIRWVWTDTCTRCNLASTSTLPAQALKGGDVVAGTAQGA